MNLLPRLYAVVLRLYPRSFRGEFAEEMQEVFTEALQDAAKQGRHLSARFFLREMGDLPANLVRQLWNQFYAWSTHPGQDQASLELASSRPGSWLSACLAGLPHLLYALALYLPLLVTVTLDLPNYRGPSLPVFWLMVAVALLIARRFGWPRWSSTWIGYGLVFLLDLISTIIPDGPLANLAGITWLCVAVLLLFWLARRDWISGLLAVLPISPMWIWLARVDGPPDSLELAALFVSIGLMLSLAVVAIVHLGRWQTALLLILVIILAAGMPDSYTAPYSGSLALASQVDPAAWSGVDGWMRSYLAIFLFTAPLWLMALWRQAQRRRAGGQNDLVG